MEVLSHSEAAADQKENEDYVVFGRHPSGTDRWLCFIADGQGGRADGAAASRIACETALSTSSALSWDELVVSSAWDEIFSAADQSVREGCQGFTTLSGAAISPTEVSGASAGDSKIFFYQPKKELLEWTARQRKNPPIGGHCTQPTFFCCTEPANGTMLAVTDGVWKYAGYPAIAAAGELANAREIAEYLRKSISASQLPDDFTVLTARWS